MALVAIKSFAVALAFGAVTLVAAGCSSSDDQARLYSGGGSGTTSERLWNIARSWANDAGADATNAVAVLTSERRAYRLLTGNRTVSAATEKSVWLVQVRGDQPFSCECDVRPGRDGTGDPRVMAILVHPPAFTTVDGAWLLTDPLHLSRAGKVIDLHR